MTAHIDSHYAQLQSAVDSAVAEHVQPQRALWSRFSLAVRRYQKALLREDERISSSSSPPPPSLSPSSTSTLAPPRWRSLGHFLVEATESFLLPFLLSLPFASLCPDSITKSTERVSRFLLSLSEATNPLGSKLFRPLSLTASLGDGANVDFSFAFALGHLSAFLVLSLLLTSPLSSHVTFTGPRSSQGAHIP